MIEGVGIQLMCEVGKMFRRPKDMVSDNYNKSEIISSLLVTCCVDHMLC